MTHRLETLLVFLALVVVLSAVALDPAGKGPGLEARVRSGIARQIVAGYPEGRHGLVGSVAWAPLPTLLALPLAPVAGRYSLPLVDALAMALLGVFLMRRWRAAGLPWWLRLGLILLVTFNPIVLMLVRRGTSQPLMMLEAAVALYFLGRWLTAHDVRSLAWTSVMSGLMLVTRAETVVLVALIFLAIATSLALRRGMPRYYARATLVVFFTPVAYAAMVWSAGNWLILGDFAYFLRGVGGFAHALVDAEASGPAFTEQARSLGALYLRQWPLVAVPALLGLMATAWDRRDLAVKIAATSALALVAAGSFVLGHAAIDRLQFEPELGITETDIEQVETYFREYYGDDVYVQVPGYWGYCFDDLGKDSPLLPSLELSLAALKDRGYRRGFYRLVPYPVGLTFWEEINLKNPGLLEGNVPEDMILVVPRGELPPAMQWNEETGKPPRLYLFDVIE